MMMLAQTTGKRQYLADYKPLGSVLLPKNIALQFGKAAILSSSQSLLKYNEYLDRSLKANENDEDIEEFDFDLLYKESLNNLYSSSKRLLATNFIQKLLEYAATLHCSMRIADRLVKDVAKSLARKTARYSRYEASRRILSTNMWSMSLFCLSGFLYDVTLDTLNYLSTQVNSARTHAALMRHGFPYAEVKASVPGTMVAEINTLAKLLTKVWKRFMLYGASLVSQSVGYAVGSYVHQTQGGPLMALAFDAVTVSAMSAALRV
jgi:hypothetical protein